MAPLADRQAAAQAFADSVSRLGTLLTSDEILGQYDRYNASETQSKDTQQVLAGILDTIEARAKADSLALEQPTARAPNRQTPSHQVYPRRIPRKPPHEPFLPTRREHNASGPPIRGIIGSGPAMEKVYRLTRQVAKSNASVLLLGETGTGKELIAKAVHQLSPRGSGPFVRVNCGALSESLLESELFGHVRGSFTGAIDNRTGRFEAAHTGTVFLDEINSTTPKLQVKLLRVLQEREFERVGDTQTIRVDTRVIAASNRDLLEEVEADRFREDLYYRLNVVPIHLPPLRERREDIPELISHFLQRLQRGERPLRGPHRPQGDGSAAGLSLARQRPRVAELHRAGRRDGARRRADGRAAA